MGGTFGSRILRAPSLFESLAPAIHGSARDSDAAHAIPSPPGSARARALARQGLAGRVQRLDPAQRPREGLALALHLEEAVHGPGPHFDLEARAICSAEAREQGALRD